jgi:putative membrane protein
MMYYGGWGWGWAMVCMVAFVAIIALVAWAIVSSTTKRSAPDDRTGSPDAISLLERRFAGGEIDENEYKRRRQLLTQH